MIAIRYVARGLAFAAAMPDKDLDLYVNGNDISDLLSAFDEAKRITDKPYVMVCDTRLFAGIDCLQRALPNAHYVAKDSADWDAGVLEISERIENLQGV